MNVKELLQRHGFTFSKKFGQNFITDTNLLSAVAEDSGAGAEDTVLEIGAGAGTLTRALAARAKRVLAFEIDMRLQPVLDESLQGCSNVSVHFEDALKAGAARMDALAGCPYTVVSNLPYNIAAPLILMFVEESRLVKSLTVMVQKEVAERLAALPGTAQYASVSVAVQSAGQVRMVRQIGRRLFYPVPNVDSAIVRIDIDRGKIQVRDWAQYKKMYRAAFAMRRKTLANNLSAAFGMDKAAAAHLITGCGFPPEIRGETLSAADFARLSDAMTASAEAQGTV